MWPEEAKTEVSPVVSPGQSLEYVWLPGAAWEGRMFRMCRGCSLAACLWEQTYFKQGFVLSFKIRLRLVLSM